MTKPKHAVYADNALATVEIGDSKHTMKLALVSLPDRIYEVPLKVSA